MSDKASEGCAVIFGANGGIGRALVERLRLSSRYASIYAGARTMRDDWPQDVTPFSFDLTDEASIKAATETLDRPPTMILVATGMLHDEARGIEPEKSLRAIQPYAMTRLFAINTIGPALIAKHFLPLLPKDRRAVFAVLSAKVGSIGDNGLGGWHSYRASKAALNMLMRNFAIEMARSHPQAVIVALHPGTVDSALSHPFQRNVAADGLFTPDRAAEQLLSVIDGLTPEAAGGLFAWDGQRLPW